MTNKVPKRSAYIFFSNSLNKLQSAIINLLSVLCHKSKIIHDYCLQQYVCSLLSTTVRADMLWQNLRHLIRPTTMDKSKYHRTVK